MINFDQCRYIGDSCPTLPEITEKYQKNAGIKSLYFIMLSDKPDELLTIYPYAVLMQPIMREYDFFAVGVEKGYKKAVAMVQHILEDVMKETNAIGRDSICQYFS